MSAANTSIGFPEPPASTKLPPTFPTPPQPAFGQLWATRLSQEISKAVVGQNKIIERLLVALLANGHVLLEGMPGLAKTLLVRSLGTALGVKFERVQFTPDLLPSDIVGTMIFNQKNGEFTTHIGPIFANLVLADEINRAPAKVQSALLEAMQERQVTIGGVSHKLPAPFFVMATQNPIEQEGTYPLPEAQTDRFLFKLQLDYPSEVEEREMMGRWGQVTRAPQLQAVTSSEELLSLRAAVDQVFVSPAVQDYILAIVRATRAAATPAPGKPATLSFGASPRASLALYQSAKALACIRGENHVLPAHVQELVPDVLRHRIGLTYEAEANEQTPDSILKDLINTTRIPQEASAARFKL